MSRSVCRSVLVTVRPFSLASCRRAGSPAWWRPQIRVGLVSVSRLPAVLLDAGLLREAVVLRHGVALVQGGSLESFAAGCRACRALAALAGLPFLGVLLDVCRDFSLLSASGSAGGRSFSGGAFHG